ncbi:MAG TPA: fibronectin type III domain-containing protein [Candidatus Limnocylindrales bacterium]|nr:fibronectin type III domain-containing protein [Candidatus Limnocylindrales bacterium]
MQRRFHSGLLHSFLAGVFAVACISVSRAQAPPDEAHVYPMGPTAVGIEFTACQTSNAPNCYLDFSIYRNPPGFTQSPVTLVSINANSSSTTVYDTGVKPGQTYAYQVCAGGYANSSRSNCIPTNTVKTPVAPPPTPTPTPKPAPTVTYYNFAPPKNLQATAAGAGIYLRWTNPPQKPTPGQITVLRTTGATAAQLVTKLTGQPSTYTDSGLLPHTGYFYTVCEGDPYVTFGNNCVADYKAAVTWGADPILTATRVNATTVQLNIAVDNFFDLYSLSVTRQGSDDPCRQGTSLRNGTQGCRTQSIGANGVAVNAPNTVTVFDKQAGGGGFGSISTSAPWVIQIQDASVKPGVEYYYIAHVTWLGRLEQDSAVVTVPNAFALASPSRVGIAGSGIKPIPLGGPRPAPMERRPSPMERRPAPMGRRPAPVQINPRTSPALRSEGLDLESAINNAKARPGDAQALYSLGQSYCANRLRSPCLSLMYMGLLQAQKAGNAQLSTEIRDRLTQEGVNLATKP